MMPYSIQSIYPITNRNVHSSVSFSRYPHLSLMLGTMMAWDQQCEPVASEAGMGRAAATPE